MTVSVWPRARLSLLVLVTIFCCTAACGRIRGIVISGSSKTLPICWFCIVAPFQMYDLHSGQGSVNHTFVMIGRWHVYHVTGKCSSPLNYPAGCVAWLKVLWNSSRRCHMGGRSLWTTNLPSFSPPLFLIQMSER